MSDCTERSCIDCGKANCWYPKENEYPAFCVSQNVITDEDKKKALATYDEDDNKKIMAVAADLEFRSYGRMTRVEEVLDFAKSMGYKKIGVATCVGLIHEANIFARIARHRGFEVYGLSCKAGEIKKVEVGIDKKCEEVGITMCNPILQAQMLAKKGTEFNVVIGLCVGHDSLFYKYSEAPVTTLVAKDRVLAHNPVGALYQANAYYKKLLKN